VFFCIDVVTSQPHASMNGLVPLIAWQIDQVKIEFAPDIRSDNPAFLFVSGVRPDTKNIRISD
jgi:hypothetical protein